MFKGPQGMSLVSNAAAASAAAADKMLTNLSQPKIRVTLLICDKNIVTTFTN